MRYFPHTFLGRYVQLITPFWLVQFFVWAINARVNNWIVWGAVVVLIHALSFYIAQREQRAQQQRYEKENQNEA